MTTARTLSVKCGYVVCGGVGWRCEDRAWARTGGLVGLKGGLEALGKTEITTGYAKVQIGFVRC